MRTLFIDRNKWARGGKNGKSMLLNDQGAMCCLGFELHSLGVNDSALSNVATPRSAIEYGGAWDQNLKNKITHLVDFDIHANSRFTSAAMRVNDDDRIDEAKREYALQAMFESVGVALVFHDG